MENLGVQIATIGLAGMVAQWFAWRMKLPAIVLLLAAGIIVGPVTDFIDPQRDFGKVYRPFISLAVAVILFEGGLSLNFREIRETSKGVRQIILIGGPLVFLMTTLAAHFVGGLSWPTATILGAILVVTGPTVIMPLLRQSRLSFRPASLLRWEAIINDPLGALLAVLSFEAFLVLNDGHDAAGLVGTGIAAAAAAIVGGYVVAWAVRKSFIRGFVPEYLKAPILFSAVIAAYAATNLILEEAGLLTVTVMGIALANSRIASLAEMRRFKETVTVLLVSGLFIMLTAALDMDVVFSLGWPAVFFVLLVLFVIRPVAIGLATINAGLSWQERVLSAWIAPRGIVAVAVSGLFGGALVARGVEDAQYMAPFAFAVVGSTIILHGFSLGPLSAILGLRSAATQGILIVGGSAWSTALAEKIRELELPVMIADPNWSRLREARLEDIPVFFGEVLSEEAHHRIDLNRYSAFIAATDNDAYNTLLCTDFGPEFGRNRVFQIAASHHESDRHSVHFTLGGRKLFDPGLSYMELNRKALSGWVFRATRLTEEYSFEHLSADMDEEARILFWIEDGEKLVFASTNKDGNPSTGDVVLSFGPPSSAKKEEPEPGEVIPMDRDLP